MAGDDEKARLYRLILQEIDKFRDPANEQRLPLISKKLGLTKQALNYYLRRFLDKGLIKKTQSLPFAIYELTVPGDKVKQTLGHSERGVKTATWRFHNLIVAFTMNTWGSWRFNQKKIKHMNNWYYQEIRLPSGFTLNVQSTNLLKIYVPHKYGPDPEIMRGQAVSEACEAAHWFSIKYGADLDAMRTIRKGHKELLGSQDLAKLFGRVKTEDFYIDASAGEENLEEPEDSFKIEKILENMELTPERLQQVESEVKEIKSMLQGSLPQQVAVSNAMNYTAAAIKNLQENATKQTEILERLSKTRDTYPSREGDRPSMDRSELQITRETPKEGLERFAEPQPLEIEFTREMPGFGYKEGGEELRVRKKHQGARIWLPEDVARQLVRDGYAKEAPHE